MNTAEPKIMHQCDDETYEALNAGVVLSEVNEELRVTLTLVAEARIPLDVLKKEKVSGNEIAEMVLVQAKSDLDYDWGPIIARKYKEREVEEAAKGV